MNRTDFFTLFQEKWNKTHEKSESINQLEAKELCISVFDLLGECVENTDKVYIKGLGTFTRKHYKAKKVGNISGGGSTILPERDKVVFESYKGVRYTEDNE